MKHVTLADSEHAQLDLSFVRRNGRTLLDRRLFSYPYVLMRTFNEAASGALQVTVQNSGGPIHDRDNLATHLRLTEGTSARVVYQGATAIHRARDGEMSREWLRITLDAGSHLSYLPPPRILFPDAAHRQLTEIELGESSQLLFTDAWTVHDPAGQGQTFREFDNTLTIHRAGELVLLDRQHLASPALRADYCAFGTVLILGPQPATIDLTAIPGLYAAQSRLPSDLGWAIRLAALDLRPIRAAIGEISAAVQA